MSRRTEKPEEAARELADGPLHRGYLFEALHTYTDARGQAVFWRIRLKHPESGDKWIRPMKRDGDGYAVGEPGHPPEGKPLYRLHELVARPDEPVFLVEGEWCADKLAALGLQATTTGGADSAAKADWRPLAGRVVVIWPDNDESGQRYCKEAAERLRALGPGETSR